MEMIPVTSENIEAYGYDPEIQELHVTFLKSGLTYAYDGVPESVVDGLKQSSSKGQYFHQYIKNGPYKFYRV